VLLRKINFSLPPSHLLLPFFLPSFSSFHSSFVREFTSFPLSIFFPFFSCFLRPAFLRIHFLFSIFFHFFSCFFTSCISTYSLPFLSLSSSPSFLVFYVLHFYVFTYPCLVRIQTTVTIQMIKFYHSVNSAVCDPNFIAISLCNQTEGECKARFQPWRTEQITIWKRRSYLSHT
jgi:hypothetical protein